MNIARQLKFRQRERLVPNAPSVYELVSPRRSSTLEVRVSQSLIDDLKALVGWCSDNLPEGNWELSASRLDTFPVAITRSEFTVDPEPKSIDIEVVVKVSIEAKEAFERSFVQIV